MNKAFWAILLIGLVLRLSLAFSTPIYGGVFAGNDAMWYMANGLALFQPEPEGIVYGNFAYSVIHLPTPPLYLLIVGFPQLFIQRDDAVRLLWIVQSMLGILTAYLSYRIAWKWTDDKRIGWLVGILITASPVMLLEPREIRTEPFYLFFVVLGLWLYIEFISIRFEDATWQMALLVGFVWGLASLSRATSILFPLGLAGHLIFIVGWKQWKRAILLAMILFMTYSAMVSTWTIHNWLHYERFVILSDQFGAVLWRGAVETDGSPQENDEQLQGREPSDVAAEVIASDPRGFMQRRLDELIASYLQPHGTLGLGGESLREMARDWLNSGLSFEGFWRLINGEGFWIKLLIYILHFGAIFGAILSLFFWRNRWKVSLVLWGFIVYTSLLHLVLLALPRYIFPTYPVFWILAAGGIIGLWDAIREKGSATTLPVDTMA